MIEVYHCGNLTIFVNTIPGLTNISSVSIIRQNISLYRQNHDSVDVFKNGNIPVTLTLQRPLVYIETQPNPCSLVHKPILPLSQRSVSSRKTYKFRPSTFTTALTVDQLIVSSPSDPSLHIQENVI